MRSNNIEVVITVIDGTKEVVATDHNTGIVITINNCTRDDFQTKRILLRVLDVLKGSLINWN